MGFVVKSLNARLPITNISDTDIYWPIAGKQGGCLTDVSVHP